MGPDEMTVWCVFEDDHEGSFLIDIYSTREAAEARAKKENAPWPHKEHYSVCEWKVTE